VLAGTDLSGVRPIRAVSTLDGFKVSDYPPLPFEFGSPFEIEAPIKIRKRYRTARQSKVPLEGKGLVAEWNRGKAFLTVHNSAQLPAPPAPITSKSLCI